MKEGKRRRLISTPRLRLEHVPELLHRIQSLVPPKEAISTCVLSKSWLHAWSTIPTLRFTKALHEVSQEQEKEKYMRLIDHTLQRYNQNNVPIESVDLHLTIENHESVSLVENWIRSIASKTCMKELSLRIGVKIDSFTLPDKIFAGENLTKISLKQDVLKKMTLKKDVSHNSLRISDHPVIKCSSLRVLELQLCHISEEVLDNLLTTCRLLEKIHLRVRQFSKTLKVKNLHYLRELKLSFGTSKIMLEVDGVPNLDLFRYSSYSGLDPLPFNIDSFVNVRELALYGRSMNTAVLDTINSKFPFLECLILRVMDWNRTVIRSDSLKRLALSTVMNRQIDIQIYAPKLLEFSYSGRRVPSLLFPVIAPEQFRLTLDLQNPIDTSSFLLLREALNLPSKFYIEIRYVASSTIANIDVDDLRRNPAIKIKQLYLKITLNEGLCHFSPFFEALFSIFHPTYLKVLDKLVEDNRYIYKLLANELTKKKSTKGYWSNLKAVEITNPNGDWNSADLKLKWCSP